MDNLGNRMKGYEQVCKTSLMKRTPVIIRIDGKAFHTFCKGFEKPFDNIMVKTMQDTMLYLCKNVQGCVLGYTQSDEITLLLKDWQTFETDAWFDNEIQKIVSVSASMATLAFNKNFSSNVWDFSYDCCSEDLGGSVNKGREKDYERCYKVYKRKINTALFDSRVFNLQKEEVCNNFVWRQQDATRNSVLSLAQSMYTQKEMQGVSCLKLQDKMFSENGVNWNDLDTTLKRGSCCIKVDGEWVIDNEIPVFSKDRSYIEKLLD